MNIEKEWAAFEAWMANNQHPYAPNSRWDVWQARAALVVERPVPGHVLPPLPEPWIMDMNSGVQEQARRHYAENQMIDYARAAIAKAEAALVEQEPVAWIEHHKAGDNLNWMQCGPDDSPLYDHPQPSADDTLIKKLLFAFRSIRPSLVMAKMQDEVDFIDAAMKGAK